MHNPCVTYGLSVLSTAAWGKEASLSRSPTSQLNLEPEGKCSPHRDNHDHTQSSWKVAYRQNSLDLRLRGRCNATYLVSATGSSCLLSHTHVYTDEHWQICQCNYTDKYSKNPEQILSSWCINLQLTAACRNFLLQEMISREKAQGSMHMLKDPTFVSTCHPFQIICEGWLSTNQVREYADLRRESR